MRTILFRGQRIDTKEWVYGDLIQKPSGQKFIHTSPLWNEVIGNIHEKQLARWIYWEDDYYYCYECVQNRLAEINKNKEFSKSIDYKGGQTCGYNEDYADEDYEVECCKCHTPLYSKVDC